MFAARNDDGTWRLSVRRGRLIKTYSTNPPLYNVEIKFSSNAKAKACADELNENVLEEYETYFARDGQYAIPAHAKDHVSAIMTQMIGIIDKHRTKD